MAGPWRVAGRYPIFVGLVRLGLRPATPFNLFLRYCNGAAHGNPEADFGGDLDEGKVLDVYRALSLGGNVSVCEPGRRGLEASWLQTSG